MNRSLRTASVLFASITAAGAACAAPSLEEAPRPADTRERMGVLSEVPNTHATNSTARTMQTLIEIQKDGLTVVETGEPVRRERAGVAPKQALPAAPSAPVNATPELPAEPARLQAATLNLALPSMRSDLVNTAPGAVVDIDAGQPVAMRSGMELPQPRGAYGPSEAIDDDGHRWSPKRLIRWLVDNHEMVIAIGAGVALLVALGKVMAGRRA
jgi:hypothetical protein